MTGDELKALRKASGLTHAQMASEMGCSLLAYIDAEQTTSHLNRDQQIIGEFVSLQLALALDDPTLARPEIRKMTAAFARLLDKAGARRKRRAAWLRFRSGRSNLPSP